MFSPRRRCEAWRRRRKAARRASSPHVGTLGPALPTIRLEMLPAGAEWWMARSARAAMMALHFSGVVFRRKWKPPWLKPWEGPFANPTRLPQAPEVTAERREARRRYRLQREQREREAAMLAEREERRTASHARCALDGCAKRDDVRIA